MQHGFIAKPPDADRGHTSGARCSNAGPRVLDHHALGRRHLQSLRRQQVDRRLVLPGILGRACGGLGDAEPLQRCATLIQQRLPGNMRLVELGCEPGGIRVTRQRLPPGLLVRRGHQHAIYIQIAPASLRRWAQTCGKSAASSDIVCLVELARCTVLACPHVQPLTSGMSSP